MFTDTTSSASPHASLLHKNTQPVTMHVHGSLFWKIYQTAPWRAFTSIRQYKTTRILWFSKLLLHLLLLILTSSILLAETYQWGEYHRAAATASCYFLVPKSCTQSNLGACSGPYQSLLPSLSAFSCTLSTRQNTFDAVSHVVEQYSNLQSSSLAAFIPVFPSVPTVSSTCDHSYLQANSLLPAIIIQLRDGSQEQYLLPLNDTVSIESMLTPKNMARALHVEIVLPLFDTLALDQYSGLYLWDFRLKLLFTAQMTFTVTTSQRIAAVCSAHTLPKSPQGTKILSTALQSVATNSSDVSLSYATFVLRILAVIVAWGYFALLVYDAQADWLLLQFAMERLPSGDGRSHAALAPAELYGNFRIAEQHVAAFNSQPFRVLARLIDGWRVFQGLSALFATIPLLMSLTQPHGYLLTTTKSCLLGACTATLYISVLGFLRYSTKYSMAALVLWGSAFKVFRILISAFPVAIGVLLMGMATFGEVDQNLSSFSEAFFTFFAVINGDILWKSIDISDNMRGLNILGCFFVVGLYVLFAYVIVRVLLAIVESIYCFLRLYTKARIKRKAYRQNLSAEHAGHSSNKKLPHTRLAVQKCPTEDLYVSLVENEVLVGML